MLVTYPIHTISMADAIENAKRMAMANGYKVFYLVKIVKVGNGVWDVTMRLQP
jgi:pyruvate/2-oxoglutarate/acetoin dehydrogenase E1 component